jgi:hypothetical protein
MTVEHRLIVGLKDILTVALECRKCGAVLSLSPDKVPGHAMYKCPSCLTEWLGDNDGVERAPLGRFLKALTAARTSEDERAYDVRVILGLDESCVSLPSPSEEVASANAVRPRG